MCTTFFRDSCDRSEDRCVKRASRGKGSDLQSFGSSRRSSLFYVGRRNYTRDASAFCPPALAHTRPDPPDSISLHVHVKSEWTFSKGTTTSDVTRTRCPVVSADTTDSADSRSFVLYSWPHPLRVPKAHERPAVVPFCLLLLSILNSTPSSSRISSSSFALGTTAIIAMRCHPTSEGTSNHLHHFNL